MGLVRRIEHSFDQQLRPLTGDALMIERHSSKATLPLGVMAGHE